MRVCKNQCSILKNLYDSYIKGKEDNEDKDSFAEVKKAVRMAKLVVYGGLGLIIFVIM